MAQGLQIWDENGINILDTNSRTVKILGKFGYNRDPVVFSHPLIGTEDTFSMSFPPLQVPSTSNLKVEWDYANSSVKVFNLEDDGRTLYVGTY